MMRGCISSRGYDRLPVGKLNFYLAWQIVGVETSDIARIAAGGNFMLMLG